MESQAPIDELEVKAKWEKSLSEMGVMCYIISKHNQEYLDSIYGMRKLMISKEFSVMNRLRIANQDFITKTDKSLKKANLDISKIEELVLDMLDKIELEFKKL
jgi:hypothetical protein